MSLLSSFFRRETLPLAQYSRANCPYIPSPLRRPAWTQGILISPLASDPRIGLEVIKCVQSFLDARQAYLISNRPLLHGGPQPNGESQDEYGAEFDRIDLDDPDLRALLEGADAEAEVEVEDPAAVEETRRRTKVAEMEKVFAGVVKERISPAIYKLLSNLLAGGGGGVEGLVEGGKEKEAYVDQLVDCWAGCANVLVQQKDQVSFKTLLVPARARGRERKEESSDASRSFLAFAGLVKLPRTRSRIVEEDRRLSCQTSSRTSVPLQRWIARSWSVRGSFSFVASPSSSSWISLHR